MAGSVTLEATLPLESTIPNVVIVPAPLVAPAGGPLLVADDPTLEMLLMLRIGELDSLVERFGKEMLASNALVASEVDPGPLGDSEISLEAGAFCEL